MDKITLFGQSGLFTLMLHTPTWDLILNPIFRFITHERISCTSSFMWGWVYIVLGMVISALIFSRYITFEKMIFRK